MNGMLNYALSNAKIRSVLAGITFIAFCILVIWIFREHLSGLASIFWPTVVGATIFGFRSEISEMLKRLRRLSKDGVEFEENRIATQILAVPVEQALRGIVPNEDIPNYITDRINAMRGEIDSLQPDDHSKREHLLMLRLAQSLQLNEFYFVWINIFLSQFEALNHMAVESGAISLLPYHKLHTERVKSAYT